MRRQNSCIFSSYVPWTEINNSTEHLINFLEATMGATMIYIFSFAFLSVLVTLVKLLHRFWWTPRHIKSVLQQQGIKGPPYRFLHGNTKEISNMRGEAMNSPTDITNNTFQMILPHIYSWKKLYGSIFLCWRGPRARLVVGEPELIKEVLNNKDGGFGRIKVPGLWKKLVGDGVASSEGQKWVRQRKLANHAFHGESLKGMIPAMLTSVEMMLEKWRKYEDKEIEIFQEMKFLTSEIISRTAFGSSYLEGEKIFSMMEKMVLIIARNAYKGSVAELFSEFVKTPDEIESDKIAEEIQNSILKIVKKREEETCRGESKHCCNDFLGLLLKAYRDTDETKRISMEDLIGECKTFYFSGQESTTTALTWAIFLLANHPEWQEKARKEVTELFGQQNPSPDGISKLKTVSMIINESLRLYSPGSHLMRKTDREVRLGKLLIPAGVEIFVPTIAVHYDPQIWGEDVHLFRPDRFSEGIAKATNSITSHYFPFGFGPRNCVGMNFAVTEAKVALSMILQRFKFVLSPNYTHSVAQKIMLYPKHGLQIILQKL